MLELFSEINWSLIGTLVVVSGVVAYVGDIVGMKLGKKRITFLKLRPKYTSRIFSVLTGVGIALVSLLFMSAASQQVRTALFSMNYVQSQITNLTAELQKNRESLEGMEMELFQSKGDLQDKQDQLQDVEQKLSASSKELSDARAKLNAMQAVRDRVEKEQRALVAENAALRKEGRNLESSVGELKKESESLKAGLMRLREGRIAVLTGENLAQGVISDKPINSYQVEQSVTRLSDETRAFLAYRFGKKPENIKPPIIDAESIAKAKQKLSGKSGRFLMRLAAENNAVEDEAVMAELQVFDTKLIFKTGTLLAERKFAAGTSREKAEEQLFLTLRDVNVSAVKAGMLRDPLSGRVGSIDTSEFMGAVEKISNSKTDVRLLIIAAEDVYTEGPLRAKFVVKQ